MSHYDQNREFYNQPVVLTEEYLKDPAAFLDRFFTDYHLTDLRLAFDEIFEVCLTTDDPPFHSAVKRSDAILLQDHLIMLVEATFLIHKNRQANGAGNQ